jgi:hypothetical protein
MKTQNLYRQGDVLFIPCNNLPNGNKRSNGTVAYGEVTGHSHRIADLTTAEVLECGDGLYLKVSDSGLSLSGEPGATITHDEHRPIDLPPGNYKIRIQTEYSPRAIRQVRD